MKKNSQWKNIFPAICVPLNQDYSINEDELRKYVSWLADFDEIDGIVCNGHTGEITSFSREERKRITQIIAEEVGSKVVVISGICCEGTLEAIDHAKDAQDAGADGILLMPPHIWLRFGMKPDSPVLFTKRVAQAIDIGIIAHLYPYSTKAYYPVDTLLKIAMIDKVKAFKIGTRHMAIYERDIRSTRENAPHISIMTCHDESLLSSMYEGVDGALIGFASCIPELITRTWKAYKDGDFPETRKCAEMIYPVTQAVYGIGQPSGEAHARMKELLYQRGLFTSALMREPVLPLNDQEKDTVRQALKITGLVE